MLLFISKWNFENTASKVMPMCKKLNETTDFF